MQPALHMPTDSTQPLLRNKELSEGWGDLCKGGRNGFFLVTLCLSWWAAARDGTTVHGDLLGILQKMVARIQGSGNTNAKDTPNDNHAAKVSTTRAKRPRNEPPRTTLSRKR